MLKKQSILFLIFIVLACKPAIQNSGKTIDIQSIPSENDVKKSGILLISQPNGLIKIDNPLASDDSTLIITVHGYKSEGYEWINALNTMSNEYSNLYFYRYDWNDCPDEVGKELAKSIDSLFQASSHINNIKIYGHSFGGLVVTYCAGNLDTNIATEVHTIASPLLGYPRILDSCELLYDKSEKLQYPEWNSNITHYQWRTQKDQDGAFRDLEYDPQDIYFNNSTVTVLPDSMDGHRLGHNWSVTWVFNYLTNNEQH